MMEPKITKELEIINWASCYQGQARPPATSGGHVDMDRVKVATTNQQHNAP